jgi:hypothetical protein
MRRVAASLLAVMFSFTLIASDLIFADTTSQLPSCCRRGGKHHCASSHLSDGSSDRTVGAAKCESFPTVKAFPSQIVTPLDTSTNGFVLAVQPSVLPRTRLWIGISEANAESKRGPPSLLS